MSDPFALLPNTIARIQKHAKPFVDTFDGVINRILDVYERIGEAERDDDVVTDGEMKDFDPASPPSFTHTKVLSIEFNKVKLARADTTWNALLDEAIRAAKKQSKTSDDLKRLILVNTVVGKKDDEGYRYLADAHMSVQGQDSNAAWKATFHIARQLGIPFEVVFTWRTKEGAAMPGVTGRFAHGGRKSHTIELPCDPVMLKRVDDLALSRRTSICLKSENIEYIGELVQSREAELLRVPDFGRKSLNEIKNVLAQMDLRLGMEVPGWPLGDVKELSKHFAANVKKLFPADGSKPQTDNI